MMAPMLAMPSMRSEHAVSLGRQTFSAVGPFDAFTTPLIAHYELAKDDIPRRISKQLGQNH